MAIDEITEATCKLFWEDVVVQEIENYPEPLPENSGIVAQLRNNCQKYIPSDNDQELCPVLEHLKNETSKGYEAVNKAFYSLRNVFSDKKDTNSLSTKIVHEALPFGEVKKYKLISQRYNSLYNNVCGKKEKKV